MARNDETKVRYGRRGMLARMGASGIAVAVPAACGSNTEDKGTGNDPLLNPTASGTGTSTGTTTATTTAAPTTTPPGTQLPPTSTPPTQTTSAPPTGTPTATNTTPPTPSTTATPTTTDTAPEASEPAPTMSTTTDPMEPPPQGSGGAGEEPPPEVDAGGGEPPMAGEVPAPPPWDDVPMCTASKTDGAAQGPFFIHNLEKDDDIELFRQNIQGQYDPAAESGVEMQLHLRILDYTSSDCGGTPVPDVEVYIWHTDAQGYYSGFGLKGTDTEQRPDTPYFERPVPGQNDLQNPDRFCRGAQTTNAEGVVSFKSYFPGWYNGRDVHIHFVALKKGTMSRGRTTYNGMGHLFTTQMYFEPALSEAVHTSGQPYLRRTEGDLKMYWEGAIKADESGNSGLRFKATFEGGIVVAQMQILLDPAGT